jgi:hypothetical protein
MKSEFDNNVITLLNIIDELYPKHITEQRKKRLRRFWQGLPAEDRIPYVMLYFNNSGFLPELKYSAAENGLLAQLAGIAGRAGWDDDYIPELSFGIRQCLIPSYFGCREIEKDGDVSTLPIIKNAADVYKLKPLTPDRDDMGTVGREMLDLMKFYYNACDGRIILSENDIQGPFSSASQIWGLENFLYALYDEPEAVHKLLEMTIEVIISYMYKQKEAARGNWSPCHCMTALWMDDSYGVCVSEDLLAVVSPDIVEEFIAPYLDKLGREFGG